MKTKLSVQKVFLFQVSVTGICVVGFHFELFCDSIMLTVCHELIRGAAPASSVISKSHRSSVRVLLRPPRWWLCRTGWVILRIYIPKPLLHTPSMHVCSRMLWPERDHILVLLCENWFWFLGVSVSVISAVQLIILLQGEWQSQPCLDARCVFIEAWCPNMVAKLGCPSCWFLWVCFVVQRSDNMLNGAASVPRIRAISAFGGRRKMGVYLVL